MTCTEFSNFSQLEHYDLQSFSLKDRKRSEDLYSLLGIQSVANVVRCGRLRWFGHVERKNRDDWVSACRNVVVAGVRCAG